MKAPQCPHWPAVEQAALIHAEGLPEGALRDHLASCETCQRQFGGDSAILQALRMTPPPDWKSEGREAVRAALTPEQVTARLRTRRNRKLLGGGLGAAGLVALAFWLRAASPNAPATTFELAASQGTSYETLSSGPETLLRLDAGSLSLHVAHLLPSQSFAINLPDGRLAVRGTRFSVSVEGGATREVAVSEGRVEIWLPGEHRLVQAGERWRALDAPPTSPSKSAPMPPPAAEAPEAPPLSNPPMVEPSARPLSKNTPPPAALKAEPEPTPLPDPSVKPEAARRARPLPTGFSDAVQRFRNGDFAAAEQALQRFVADHPADRRSEDALFLRIRSLQYLNRHEEARAEAARYLNLYSQGLRRPEVEQVLAP